MTVEQPQQNQSKIIKQLEFYFSPANLRRDKFMQQQLASSDNGVKLETLLKFNRLMQLLKSAASSTDASESDLKALLADCVRQCPALQLADGEICRLNPEHAPESVDISSISTQDDTCTLMVEKLPVTATLDQLLEFFQGKSDAVLVQMRRSKTDSSFTGSAWVEFASPKAAETFLASTELHQFPEGNQLKVSTKEEYLKTIKEREKKYPTDCLLEFILQKPEESTEEVKVLDKRSFIQSMKSILNETYNYKVSFIDFALPSAESAPMSGTVRFLTSPSAQMLFDELENGILRIPATGGNMTDPDNGFDLCLKVRVIKDEEEREMWKQIKDARSTRDQPTTVERTYPENHFLRVDFSGAGKDVVTQAFLERELSKMGRIRFLDYCKPPLGETEAVIRFYEPVAQKICDELSGKLGEIELTSCEALKGEENTKLWNLIYDRIDQSQASGGAQRGGNQRGGKRRGGFGGRGGNKRGRR